MRGEERAGIDPWSGLGTYRHSGTYYAADGDGAYAFDDSGNVTGYRETDEAAASRLLDFIANIRPAWHADAACRNAPHPDMWFPVSDTPGTLTAEALAVCATCPVREQCREAGRQEAFGIWGGERQSTRGHGSRPQPSGVGRSVRHRPALPVEQVGTWCPTFYQIAGEGSLSRHRTHGGPICEPCRTYRAARTKRYTANVKQRERTASQ